MTGLLNDYRDKMTDEVMETVFCEVESMVNSRPITKVSDDVLDSATLSPNQILIINDGFKSSDYYNTGDLYKKRWRVVQYIANQFWKRWLKEYIPELQKRRKWRGEVENIKVGDVVLICEENTPRFLWPLALVVGVKLGRDKLVRTVHVKTKTSNFSRPVSKVVKLEGGASF